VTDRDAMHGVYTMVYGDTGDDRNHPNTPRNHNAKTGSVKETPAPSRSITSLFSSAAKALITVAELLRL